MNEPVDLIDQFTTLILSADDPRGLAERTLEVAMVLCSGQNGAVFVRDADRMTLFASRGIDDGVLAAVQTIWANHRGVLQKGEAFYVAERATDARVKALPESLTAASFALVPVFEGDSLVALLYVDSPVAHFCNRNDLERLRKFSRILVKAVGIQAPVAEPLPKKTSLEEYLENATDRQIQRERLLLLLNRNEWNIARVARLLGVTRRTVYQRLQRFSIQRERRPKRTRTARA